MIRSIIAASVLFLAVPGTGAQQDDALTELLVDGPQGTRMEGGPLFGASGIERLEDIQAAARGRVFPAQGDISEVDFDGPTAVIDGLRYEFAPGAVVTLLDGYGAPTLLRSGMTARFVFEETGAPGTAGRIHHLEQIAPDASLAH